MTQRIQQLHRPRSAPQDIGRLLSLASTSLALLALPQTDAPDAGLPEGDDRSEQFVAKVGEYFETLDVRHPSLPFTPRTLPSIHPTHLQGIQMTLCSSLAHIRAARISPTVLTAPPAGFVSPPQGVGLPFSPGSSGRGSEEISRAREKTRGLLEERVERDAWRGALDSLTRLRDAKRSKAEAERRRAEVGDENVYMSGV